MAIILGVVVALAFGWYWWRGTSYGALVMTLTMAFMGLAFGRLILGGDNSALFLGVPLGGFLAWGPY